MQTMKQQMILYNSDADNKATNDLIE